MRVIKNCVGLFKAGRSRRLSDAEDERYLFLKSKIARIMTLVHMMGDGSTVPVLKKQNAVILIDRGEIYFGSFNGSKYVEGVKYIDEPANRKELESEIVDYVNNECTLMLNKLHPVLVLCPQSIAKRMVFEDKKIQY